MYKIKEIYEPKDKEKIIKVSYVSSHLYIECYNFLNNKIGYYTNYDLNGLFVGTKKDTQKYIIFECTTYSDNNIDKWTYYFNKEDLRRLNLI